MGMPVSAEDKLSELKESKALPRAKWHVCSNGKNLDRLVIGVGQLHPVLTGKFEAFQANRIAKVQAWIFDTLEYLYQKQGVKTFGQEGFSSGGSDLRKARLDDSILDQLKQVIEKHSSTESFLRRIAQKWRKALRGGRIGDAKRASTALSSLTLLQALHEDVTVFPIEQRDVHSSIGENLQKLQHEIASIEASREYAAYRAKSGKGLDQAEYDVAKRRNKLVDEFNEMISHPERDRAIFSEVLKVATDSNITVFVLGQGHRSNFLTIARENLPEGVLFAWVTPPAFWWWRSLLWKIGTVIAIGFVGYAVWFLR